MYLYPVMRIVRFILPPFLLAFFSIKAYCQPIENKIPTMEDIRQCFLVEGLRVDSYAFADTLESILKPKELNIPAKIQELESRLPHVNITEKQQIAKKSTVKICGAATAPLRSPTLQPPRN